MSEAEEHLFTVEEANAVLPRAVPILERLQQAHREMAERQEEVESGARGNGGGPAANEYIDASRVVAQAIGELEDMGILVRDPETGLVDFPSQRGGEPVYLCWRLGEPAVSWWHPIDTGIAGRQPL